MFKVSIHAPAWGATTEELVSAAMAQVSIHAPAWGATALLLMWTMILMLFQSTHPRGVRRHPHQGGDRQPTRFNPRTRVGCDAPDGKSETISLEVSIHAPAWGATMPNLRHYYRITVSIHAPAWGATLGAHVHADLGLVSIHAPAWGATP